jgi:hypothetical protein
MRVKITNGRKGWWYEDKKGIILSVEPVLYKHQLKDVVIGDEEAIVDVDNSYLVTSNNYEGNVILDGDFEEMEEDDES